MKAVIALGSNLGDSEKLINQAIAELSDLVIKRSSIFRCKPLVKDGAEPQAEYLNAVVLIETERAPREILNHLHDIERSLGRNRLEENERWLSRTIDLDLICVEQQEISTTEITLPHAEMHKRDFVLVPMSEVWPDWKHPQLKKTVQQLLEELEGPRFILN
jgi:2-amino-4-hydroxy-6-hydroxymethyldihydropteridine diphosphokinase